MISKKVIVTVVIIALVLMGIVITITYTKTNTANQTQSNSLLRNQSQSMSKISFLVYNNSFFYNSMPIATIDNKNYTISQLTYARFNWSVGSKHNYSFLWSTCYFSGCEGTNYRFVSIIIDKIERFNYSGTFTFMGKSNRIYVCYGVTFTPGTTAIPSTLTTTINYSKTCRIALNYSS